MDVAVATCTALPEPDPDAPYYQAALERAGLSAAVLAWDDPAAPFDQAALVVIRSTWNYIHNYPDYLAWVDRMGARLHNPPALVRWNSHKRYLVDAAHAGLRVVPTRLVERGDATPLDDQLDASGWTDAVVKPAVSAGSFETRRVSRGALRDEDRAWYARLAQERDLLIQPFVRSVEGYGERSIVTLDGAISHAIRKSPRFFDANESVSESALPIADDEAALATSAITFAAERAGVGSPLMYGRVDMARDEGGAPMIMELELIEPSLFFGQHPPAADAWARAIARRLRG